MEIEVDEEKSIDSFQAEMDLVKEEEEEENRLSQKERLAQILSKIKKQNDQEENVEISESNGPQVLRSNPNVLRATQKKIQDDASKVPEPFNPNFKLNERYFYQNINVNEWGTISELCLKIMYL